eukprot:TRINITY_DN242_c0_g1_i2.p1 TRINITY_DN242_c0_g1~~TRINITY_DN242_c0_g1_i2.p1  ORF type:complete len:620 (+),score=144.77 TRINITY_DN242_c0_g1_i2:63-1922(+)
MKLLTLILLSLCIIWVQSGQILLLDCDGNLFAFPKENQEHAVAINLGNYVDMMSYVSDRFSKRFGCVCPRADPQDFLKVYTGFNFWTADFWANIFSKDPMQQVPGCEAHQFPNAYGLEFRLPVTCDWGRDKKCLAMYEIAESVTFQVAVAQCPNSHIPFISINCNGTGCDSLGKPCVSDSECGGALRCNPFLTGEKNEPFPGDNEMSQQLLEAIRLASEYPACGNPMKTASTLANYMRKFMYNTNEASLGDHIQYCSPGVFRSKDFQATLNESTRIFDCEIYHSQSGRQMTDCVSGGGPVSVWDGYNNEGVNVLTWKQNGPYKIQPNTPHPRTPGAVVVLDIDCNDNIQVLPGSRYGTQVHVTNLRKTFNLVYDAYRSKLDCESKHMGFKLNDAIMAANYLLPEFGMLFTRDPAVRKEYLVPVQTFASYELNTNDSPPVILPSTCSLESWENNGTCEVSYTGLSSLLGMDVTFNVAIKKCDYREFPNIYVECVGTDCNQLNGLVECDPSQPSTCPNGECQSAKDLLNEVSDMGSYAEPVDLINIALDIYSPSCPFTNTTEITNDYQALLRMFGHNENAHVCYPSFERIQQTAPGWARTQVYQSGNVIKLSDVKSWISPK